MQWCCAQPEPRTFLPEAQIVDRPISVSNQPFRTSKSRYDAEAGVLARCARFLRFSKLGKIPHRAEVGDAGSDGPAAPRTAYIPLLRHNIVHVEKGIVITWYIVEPPNPHCKTPCSENHSAHCCLSSGLSSWGEYCDKPFGSKYEPLGNSSSTIPRTITAPPCSTDIVPGR